MLSVYGRGPYAGEISIDEWSAVAIEVLQNSISLSVLLNDLSTVALRQSINLALVSIINPTRTQINYTTTIEGRAPRLAANTIARFKDDARQARA